MNISIMLSQKEFCLMVFLKRSPIATDDTVMGNDGLENTAVVVRLVFVVGRKNNVTAFVADEVFVVRRNQEIFPLAETSCAAIISQIEFPRW